MDTKYIRKHAILAAKLFLAPLYGTYLVCREVWLELEAGPSEKATQVDPLDGHIVQHVVTSALGGSSKRSANTSASPSIWMMTLKDVQFREIDFGVVEHPVLHSTRPSVLMQAGAGSA
jgi:hypothetical protein